MVTKTVTLTVPNNFILPSWYETANPLDVAAILEIGTKVPDFLGTQSERLDVRKSVYDALRDTSASDAQEAMRRAEARAEEATAAMQRIRDECAEAISNEKHLRGLAEYERGVMEKTLNDRVMTARKEVSLEIRAEMQDTLDKARADALLAHENKMKVENDMCAILREKCEAVEQHGKVTAGLQARISELETPMGRGSTGEVDVAQCLRDMGFVVEDTSTGNAKNAGYLDLLAYPETCSAGQNMRIAFEVKNCKEVKREYKTAFEEHVRNGIAKGLFDSAVFVSIRAHVKRDKAVALDMYEDDDQRPLVPVSWIGPERAKNAMPLTQDQFEAHVFMHTAILEHAHAMRTVLAQERAGATEGDMQILQTFVDTLVIQLNDTFSELGRQHQLVEDMKENLTRVRVQCIQMFMTMCRVNRDVSWLSRNVTAPWLSTFEVAKRKAATHNDTQIWNDCSKTKTIIEKTIGKEAMLAALRATSPTSKRLRTE
jgi:hypothetical protein